MRLVRESFCGREHPGLFGIRECQMRGHEHYHNAGWFNVLGQKIGWGDLDKNDIDRIMNELEEDELFIVLSERDSYWNFVEELHPIMLGGFHTVQPTMHYPGIEYVRDHAVAFIRKGEHKWISQPYPKLPNDAMSKDEWIQLFDEYLKKVVVE